MSLQDICKVEIQNMEFDHFSPEELYNLLQTSLRLKHQKISEKVLTIVRNKDYLNSLSPEELVNFYLLSYEYDV